jgi:hypothetical protein
MRAVGVDLYQCLDSIKRNPKIAECTGSEPIGVVVPVLWRNTFVKELSTSCRAASMLGRSAMRFAVVVFVMALQMALNLIATLLA